MLDSLSTLSHLVLTTSLQDTYYYIYSYFIDGETGSRVQMFTWVEINITSVYVLRGGNKPWPPVPVVFSWLGCLVHQLIA